MYILNEKEYIRNVLASKKKPSDLTMGYLITLTAKYYYKEDLDSVRLGEIVKRKLSEFELEQYQEYKYHQKIMGVCDGLFQGTLSPSFKERASIPIYEKELALVNSLKNDRQKKVMFTLLAVARYMDCDGWINKKNRRELSEVFKLANVTLTSEKRNALLHELLMGGYISFGKKIDNLNIRVNLDDSGNVVYQIKNFTNIGNQYIGNFKKGYKQCQCCGKPYKVQSAKDFSSKYCDPCAYDAKLKQNKLYYHEKIKIS